VTIPAIADADVRSQQEGGGDGVIRQRDGSGYLADLPGPIHRALVATNRLRTACWTAHTPFLLVMVAFLFR
jgi:hypothetical protein